MMSFSGPNLALCIAGLVLHGDKVFSMGQGPALRLFNQKSSVGFKAAARRTKKLYLSSVGG